MMTSNSAIKQGQPKLIWLFFMHRHGDRSPLNMGPKDKYNDLKYWPEGFGNLDNADSFREVYSRSSDVERCIESSSAVLAGMYPPSDRFRWDEELPWIPAPVHTVPAPEDYLLNEAGREYVQEIQDEIKLVQKSEAVKKLYEDSVAERQLLERELGYEYETFYKFSSTYSTLDIEEKQGLQMPEWYTPELKKQLYKFAGIGFYLAMGGTERLRQLRSGHLLEDMIQRMQLATAAGHKRSAKSEFQQPTNAPADISDRKVVHYSTHDSILAAFLTSLNLNSPPIPPRFGATFFIELYVDIDDEGRPISEKYLKLFYLDVTESEEPIERQLPGCKLNDRNQVTLDNFVEFVKHLLPVSSV